MAAMAERQLAAERRRKPGRRGQAWAVLHDDDLVEPTTDQERAAVMAICGRARDADDARLILDALGLLAALGVRGEVLASYPVPV